MSHLHRVNFPHLSLIPQKLITVGFYGENCLVDVDVDVDVGLYSLQLRGCSARLQKTPNYTIEIRGLCHPTSFYCHHCGYSGVDLN